MAIKENVEGMDRQMKLTVDKVQAVNRRISEQETKIEEAERYSRRWNLKLLNLPEAASETTEDVSKHIFDMFGTIVPEEKNNCFRWDSSSILYIGLDALEKTGDHLQW